MAQQGSNSHGKLSAMVLARSGPSFWEYPIWIMGILALQDEQNGNVLIAATESSAQASEQASGCQQRAVSAVAAPAKAPATHLASSGASAGPAADFSRGSSDAAALGGVVPDGVGNLSVTADREAPLKASSSPRDRSTIPRWMICRLTNVRRDTSRGFSVVCISCIFRALIWPLKSVCDL